MSNQTIYFKNAQLFDPANPNLSEGGEPRGFTVSGGRFREFVDPGDVGTEGGFDRIIDLGGCTVLPAFTDSHIHLVDLSQTLAEVDLEASRSEQEAVDIVVKAAADAEPGEWIVGNRWAHNFWEPSVLPTAASLDAHFPANPVILHSKCGHVLWCNTAALQAAMILDNPPEVEGGKVDVDPKSGRAIGTLKENAISLVTSQLPRAPLARRKALLDNAVRHLHEFGILNIQNVERLDYFETIRAWETDPAYSRPLRVYDYFPDLAPHEIRKIMDEHDPALRLRPVGKKIFTDGALGGRTAYMLAPYIGEPDNLGIATMTPAELREIIAEAEKFEMPCAIHAIGDAAVRFTLESIRDEAGPQVARCRGNGRLPHRIEHLQLLAPGDWDLYQAVQPVASMQPIHLSADIQPLHRFWGDKRSRHAYAFRTVEERGGMLAFGSDAPVESANPFLGIYAALTRQQLNGSPEGGYFPEEKIAFNRAVRAYSEGPTYVVGESARYGRLAPGLSADFIVLNETRTAESIPAEEWKNVTVASLYCEGNAVFPADR